MSGFHAIDRIVTPKQPVAVGLLDIVEREIPDRIPAVVVGKFPDDRLCQDRQVTRFRIRDDSIFGRVKQRMRDWFYQFE